MKPEAVSGIVLMLVLASMLRSAFNIQPVKADYTWGETLYIRADGSVEPVDAPISTVDYVTYTLTDNIVGAAPTKNDKAVIIERNNTALNGAGYTLQGTGGDLSKGIYLYGRSNVTIKNINIRDFDYGVYLNHSSYDTVSGNNITNNRGEFGVGFTYSSNNTFYHNNFVENFQQVYLEEAGYANVWDDGYPSGGNYWSDYNGTDLYSGRYQNETGSDNIGDTPYIIDENNRDNYPLMNPFEPLLGDVNLDGKVDIFDVVSIVSAYGSKLGNINWNPLADIAPPFGTVNIFDIVTCTQHYGETWGA